MPICGTSGFGITIVVCPAYAINKGSAAIDGSTNFLFFYVDIKSKKETILTLVDTHTHCGRK
jgi:hypothetical protein